MIFARNTFLIGVNNIVYKVILKERTAILSSTKADFIKIVQVD